MQNSICQRLLFLLLLCANALALAAAPREAEWAKVVRSIKLDQPQTAIGLLKPIEAAAFADHAWAEGAKALAMRVLTAAAITKDETEAVRQLAAELPSAPAPALPILRLLEADLMLAYYQKHGYPNANRSPTGGAPGADMARWDLPRLLAEIDQRLQAALADSASLRLIPVSDFAAILAKGGLGDEFRPTLYDFIAHEALQFYGSELVAISRAEDPFEITLTMPVLADAAAFLAWQPAVSDNSSLNLRTLHLYQDLLSFHRNDADPTAYLHCDLERLRWAAACAVGEHRGERADAALRAFITANARHPLSADARQDVVLHLRFANRTREAHDVAKQGADAFPAHPFGKLCRTLVADLEAQELSVKTMRSWTPAGEDLYIRHANLQHVWLRLYRRSWKPGASTLSYDEMPYDAELEAILAGKPARAWDAGLPDDGDFRTRVSKLPAPADLPPGYYLLVISTKPNFALAHNHLAIRGIHFGSQALLLRTYEAAGLVTDAVTGAPAPGVAVTQWSERKGQSGLSKFSATSDDAGSFALRPNCPSLVVAGSGANQAVARSYNCDDADQSRKEELTAVLFTDRALYRPGQSIHFKGIVCRTDQAKGSYHTVANHPLTVGFFGANKNRLQVLDVVTNARGSFNGTFTAPAGGLTGRCQIAADGIGSVAVSVEETKRPRFFAEILPPAAPAVLGASVHMKVRALSYTGAAVDGAKVTWTVRRSVSLPDSCRSAGMRQRYQGGTSLRSGCGVTGADGSFEIAFAAEPDRSLDPANDPVFEYDVAADVTDPAGETRSAGELVSAGYSTLKVKLDAKRWQEQGKPVTLQVSSASHDERAVAATGILHIYRLREPAVCPRDNAPSPFSKEDLTPEDPAESADPGVWALGETVQEIPLATRPANDDCPATAEASIELPAGCYRAVFTAKDANGRQVQAIHNLQVLNPAAPVFPTKLPFFTASPALEVQPGQPFTLLWGSGHTVSRACVEWLQDGKLLKREWSAPGRTQQTFAITVDESMRGGFTARVTQTTLNRLEQAEYKVSVPWTNKNLTLRWEHLSSKLEPGAKDVWTAVVSTQDGRPADAELVATLYDASLDAFVPHSFEDFAPLLRAEDFTSEVEFHNIFEEFGDANYSDNNVRYWLDTPFRGFAPGLSKELDHMAGNQSSYGDWIMRRAIARADEPDEASRATGGYSGGGICGGASIEETPNAFRYGDDPAISKPAAAAEVVTNAARKNLQETAFFYPDLTSDDKGEVRISFTMPEALTKWQFLGFAHDKDMRFGSLVGETLTAKDLMVQPNPPRFLREGDVLDFTVKISNQSDKEQSGSARLTLTDAATRKDATAALGIAAPDQPWKIPAKESRTLSWHLTVPDGCGVLSYKALATSGTLSDGEEGWLPVISRRVRLTESMSLPIRDAGSKEFTFQKLVDSGTSSTLQNRLVQVQVVSQPAWHAVLALPYLMEFPHQCAEQTFNRYYANALARHIAKSDPKIRRIFELWKNTPALDSPLTKDAELKGLLLEETPWLAEAGDQSQARRNLGLLFDDNHLTQQLETSLKMLGQMQDRDGLWPWFPGGQANETISLVIATGFARLRALGVETDVKPALKALTELDARLSKRFAAIQHAAKKDAAILQSNHLDVQTVHFLYARTFFLKDRAVKPGDKDAFNYFCAQARQFWPSLDARMSRAHVALALARLGDNETARLITRSLRENATSNDETGMSWHDAGAQNWGWWQAPIETQAMMIEAFREIDHDAKAVKACQVWLIQQKQLREWHSTKATADAIHALLMGGGNLLGSDALVEVALGGTPLKPEAAEPGSGLYEARFAGPSIKPELGHIRLTKTDPGVAWASISWQYLDDLAKVTAHETSALKLEKKIYVRKPAAAGPKLEALSSPVRVGDELVTRLILRNERAMEFVHLKDSRGSGTEPVNVLSGFRWQDGVGCYEETRDSSSHFFIDALPAGTHVFETSARAQHAGIYQTGTAEISCMYAPGFSAHSASVRLEVVP